MTLFLLLCSTYVIHGILHIVSMHTVKRNYETRGFKMPTLGSKLVCDSRQRHSVKSVLSGQLLRFSLHLFNCVPRTRDNTFKGHGAGFLEGIDMIFTNSCFDMSRN